MSHTRAEGRQPLAGCRILDFSNLLPGPFATQILGEAGADIIKIERPEGGDELRSGTPKWGNDSLGFALLNAGKMSISLNLKSPEERNRLLPLVREADILVEQFRPGVMDRLGLGYEALKKINPRLIYCSITGYGQSGPNAQTAGHDLTYMAESGLLSLTQDSTAAPSIPPVLVADIGAGTLPAVINILLALRHRDIHGEGCRLDMSIVENLLSFSYSAMSRGAGYGQWPVPGGERLTGGTARYQIYRTSDDRHVAAAPLEQRFWDNFCDLIELAPCWRDDAKDPLGTKSAVAQLIRQKSSAQWRALFKDRDVCAVVVNTMQEAAALDHFKVRGTFDRKISNGTITVPALNVPLDTQFLREAARGNSPELGENNGILNANCDNPFHNEKDLKRGEVV